MADFDKLPRFECREEPAGVWMSRVGASLAGMLALGGWTWRNLCPARVGRLSS